MPRRLSLLAAAFLLSPGAVAPRPACPVETGVQDIFGAPVLHRPIAANQPVAIAPGAVLALEEMRIATRIWRSERPIALTGRHAFTYPPGVAVTALRTEAGERRCLRDALGYRRGPSRGRLIPCLIDADGDGAHEAAELFRRESMELLGGRRAQFNRIALVQLAEPVRLAEDPAGLERGRFAALRRVVVVAAGPDHAVVELGHASLLAWQTEPSSLPARRGRPVAVPDYRAWPGSRRAIRFTDGATETIAGVRFRIERSMAGWTATPLDARFPRWIELECEGAVVRTGRS